MTSKCICASIAIEAQCASIAIEAQSSCSCQIWLKGWPHGHQNTVAHAGKGWEGVGAHRCIACMHFLQLLLTSLLHLVDLLLELGLTKLKVQLLLLQEEVHRSQGSVQSCFWVLTT